MLPNRLSEVTNIRFENGATAPQSALIDSFTHLAECQNSNKTLNSTLRCKSIKFYIYGDKVVK